MNAAALIEEIATACRPPTLAYCDYISAVTRRALVADADKGSLIKAVGHTRCDLHPTEGYMLSTKKTIEVVDRAGTHYRVTVEVVPNV